MATKIKMKNPSTGVVKTGVYGFSQLIFWVGFFLPIWLVLPIFRGDLKNAAIYWVSAIVLGLIFLPLALLVWLWVSFDGNDRYTKYLLEQGYKFAGTDEENKAAAVAVGVELLTPEDNS